MGRRPTRMTHALARFIGIVWGTTNMRQVCSWQRAAPHTWAYWARARRAMRHWYTTAGQSIRAGQPNVSIMSRTAAHTVEGNSVSRSSSAPTP